MALMMNWVERMDNPGIIDDDSEDMISTTLIRAGAKAKRAGI